MNEKLPSGLPQKVDDSEYLARYIIESRMLTKKDQRIKTLAFLPNINNGETSVFRQENQNQICWNPGKETAATRNKNLYGAAVLKASCIQKNGLRVEAKEPPPKHANIIGWVEDQDKVLEKAKNKALAASLAADAIFYPYEAF